ncbi:MAG: Anti-sigma-28 factor, FlgM [Pseudomonadota bacterium]
MKIEGQDKAGIGVGLIRKALTAPAETRAIPRSAAAQPSERARAVTGELVVRLAAQGAPVDRETVNAIRDALARGEYPIDARKIADAMIALDLG